MLLGMTTNIFVGPLKSGEVDLEGVVSLASDYRMKSLEIRDDSASLGEARVIPLVSKARENGLTLSYAIKNDMLASDDRSLFQRATRLASLCGKNTVLRVLASQEALKPDGKRGYSREELHRLKVTAEEYGGIASGVGVRVAIENARDPLYGDDRGDYFGMADLMREVSSSNVGLTFDPANATNTSLCKSPSTEEDVLKYVREQGARIMLTHYKTTRKGAPETAIGDADVDNARLLSELSKVFGGTLCVEIPGAPGLRETKASIQSSLDYLYAKGLVQKYLA